MANSNDTLTFSAICSLLDKLEALRTRYYAPGTKKFTKREFGARQRTLVSQWTELYIQVILKDGQLVLAALSLLFPDLRTDRVYVMKEHVLAGVIARAFGMGSQGLNKLRQWRLNDGDFGVALEPIMTLRVFFPCIRLIRRIQGSTTGSCRLYWSIKTLINCRAE